MGDRANFMGCECPSDLEEFVEDANGTIIAAEEEAVPSGADATNATLLVTISI